jgi:glucose-6-phosphate isomerase
MKELATQIRAGRKLGATGRPIRAVVNIGIGGSDLGPLLVCDALAPPTGHGGERAGIDIAFVSNVDPEHLTRALAPLDPATTLFIVISKTFTTQETLANATSAKSWLAAGLAAASILAAFHCDKQHNRGACIRCVIVQCRPWDCGWALPLWPVVLPIVIGPGSNACRLLAGAASIDANFARHHSSTICRCCSESKATGARVISGIPIGS